MGKNDGAGTNLPSRCDSEAVESPDTLGSPTMEDARDPVFSVVGIGASAGGLAALSEVLHGLPRETEAAAVVLQHQDPSSESLLLEIIRDVTPMNVSEAIDGVEVCSGTVFVVPPDCDVRLLSMRLQVVPRAAPIGQWRPIDGFFSSLGLRLKDRSVGVVLSGAGADGTSGARTIRSEGGLVIA